MRKFLLFFALILGICISCTRTKCECADSKSDYVGHCTCGGENCTCPVRLHIVGKNGCGQYDVWHKDPLTTSDTLYIQIQPTMEEFVLEYITYGYYFVDMLGCNEYPYILKLVLPEGKYSISASYSNTTPSSILKVSEIILPEVVVLKSE